MPRILLIGGHGRVSLQLTPKAISRDWDLTSLIRNPDQKAAILEAAAKGQGPESGNGGKIDVLVHSLEDVKSEEDARRVLEETKAEWVVWSAGAGGKGGPGLTNAIDRDACIHFIRASISSPKITKFLLVSALSSRRGRAPWWDDDSWSLVERMNTQFLKHYYTAKLDADETLTVLGERRIAAETEEGKSQAERFSYVVLRPGGLSDEEESGKVAFGKTKARGFVTRGDVAEVAVRLLEREGVIGWFDLLGGEEDVGVAIERVLKEGVDAREGEDLEAMRKRVV